MYKVLVCDKMDQSGVDIFRQTEGVEVDVRVGMAKEELLEAVEPYHGIVVRSATKITADVMERARNLRVVGRAGAGVDNIDVPAATQRGVLVMNTPGGNTVTTAEHAMAMMLSLARHTPQANRSLKEGKWEKSKFMGREVDGKVLGLVGLGNVGQVVARQARGMGMTVLAADPFVSPEMAKSLEVELVKLDELLVRADIISLHSTLNDETRGLINKKTLDQMKQGVLIVNCARGGLIDEGALLEALQSGKVAGAALDVFAKEPPGDNPLLKLDNVIATPHLGASTGEAQAKVAVAVARQMAAFLTKGAMEGAINAPSLKGDELDRLSPYMALARRLGRLHAMLREGPIGEVEMLLRGELAKERSTPVTSAFLAAFLEAALAEPVNLINVATVAASRGIKVMERKISKADVFASSLEAVVRGPSWERSVAGIVFGQDMPRLVQIDDFRFEVALEGHILVTKNQDRPGVVGKLGTLLGNAGINISRLQLSLPSKGKDAMALWNLDGPIPESLLEELRAIPYMTEVKQVSLED